MAMADFRAYKRYLRGSGRFLRLLQCGRINGFGIGQKRVQGRQTTDLAITVYVNKKLPLRQLSLADTIPQRLQIPHSRAPGGLLEFVTDIEECEFYAFPNTDRERPARSGISIGHVDITAGTLGGLLSDKKTGDVVILSNNHVLANSNEGQNGDPILQPGPADGGTEESDTIALLERFVEIDFANDSENKVDAAIAAPCAASDVLWNTVDIGEQVPLNARNLGDSDLGLFVRKSGRTTGHTQGFVQAVYATTRVKYDLFKIGTFVDQIVVSHSLAEEPFSEGGDSGSLVYDSDNKCVGLLFAGSSPTENNPGTTIVNPIRAVLRELDLEFLSPGDHPTTPD